jgi:hypothetical protein
MGSSDRNDRLRMAAFSAEEERRRVNAEAARSRRQPAADAEGAGRRGRWSSRISAVLGRIRRALGR